MASQGRVSAELSTQDAQQVKQAIGQISAKLPFVVALSPEERHRMFKLGPKSVDFVEKIAGIAKEHPELVPAGIDSQEFQRDAALVKSLGTFEMELTKVAEGVQDTRMAAGSDAMATALVLYGMLQAAKRQVPGLDQVMEEIGARFARGRRSASGATTSK